MAPKQYFLEIRKFNSTCFGFFTTSTQPAVSTPTRNHPQPDSNYPPLINTLPVSSPTHAQLPQKINLMRFWGVQDKGAPERERLMSFNETKRNKICKKLPKGPPVALGKLQRVPRWSQVGPELPKVTSKKDLRFIKYQDESVILKSAPNRPSKGPSSCPR